MFDADIFDGEDAEVLDELVKELRLGWHKKEVECEIRTQHASKIRQEATSMEGLGRLRLSIDPTSFHYWGQREGYEAWDDKGFVNEYERDNPQARVAQNSNKIQVVNIPISNKRSTTVLS